MYLEVPNTMLICAHVKINDKDQIPDKQQHSISGIIVVGRG